MPTVAPPLDGDYLSDGKRLVMVLGINRDGDYEVEDAVTDELILIPAHELSRWRVVRRA